MREIGIRLLLVVVVPVGMLVLGVFAALVIAFGQSEQRQEILRGMSRTLSGCWDGQGDCTASAWSYYMVTRGKRWGPVRVRFIDWLNQSPGHCQRAYAWHMERRLFEVDGLDV